MQIGNHRDRLTYPSNLSALLDHFKTSGGFPPALRQVRTIGETPSAETRERCRRLGDVEVVEHPLSNEQETRLTAIIHSALGHAFPLRFNYFSQELAKTRGGKFEEFVSLVS